MLAEVMVKEHGKICSRSHEPKSLHITMLYLHGHLTRWNYDSVNPTGDDT